MQNRKYIVIKALAALVAATTLVSCSLLKVAVSTGDPMTREQMNVRLMTRGFYYDFSGEVARAADSIATGAADPKVRVGALRWKIRATRAAVTAAMQAIPDVALADLWILCRRMNESFAALPDSLLFNDKSDIARHVAADLEQRVSGLARQSLKAEHYAQMADFVERFVREHPAGGDDMTSNTTLAWVEYLRSKGVQHAYTTGTIAEVLADVSDRVSGQTQQLSNSIGWSKDLIEMQWQQDTLRESLVARLDSLDAGFSRIATVAEGLPGLSERLVADLGGQASHLVSMMNRMVAASFADLDRQRGELQEYVSVERQALSAELRATGADLLREAMDALPGLIGKVVLYLTFALLLLLGIPFALGFWLGGVRERRREKRMNKEE